MADDMLTPIFYAITYLDEAGEPTACCFVHAFDYHDACGQGWSINPQAHEFVVEEMPALIPAHRKAA